MRVFKNVHHRTFSAILYCHCCQWIIAARDVTAPTQQNCEYCRTSNICPTSKQLDFCTCAMSRWFPVVIIMCTCSCFIPPLYANGDMQNCCFYFQIVWCSVAVPFVLLLCIALSRRMNEEWKRAWKELKETVVSTSLQLKINKNINKKKELLTNTHVRYRQEHTRR